MMSEPFEELLARMADYDQHCSDDDVDRLLAEIERLRAIVDKLPKTADGVPVVPGMVCWYRSCGGRVASFQVSDWSDIATDWDDYGPKYYSTREAAQAAGEG